MLVSGFIFIVPNFVLSISQNYFIQLLTVTGIKYNSKIVKILLLDIKLMQVMNHHTIDIQPIAVQRIKFL